MLEILSHQYLKSFVQSHNIDWIHIYSFGRIISRCIANNATYLVNSEIFSTRDWIPAILISLFLQEEDSIFVLSEDKIDFFKKNQINKFNNLGFKFVMENDQIVFSSHKVHLITFKSLLKDSNLSTFKNHRIVLSGIEDLQQDLKSHFRISLNKNDWFNDFKQSESIHQEICRTYNFFKKKFFSRKILGNSYLFLDKKEISLFSNFFNDYSFVSEQFANVSYALSQSWACWIKIDNRKLEWELYLQPIEEHSLFREFLSKNKFVFLSAMRKDNFFQDYLKKQSLKVDLVINFKSNFKEKKIFIYVPPKQLLPNNPSFTEAILNKCKKLIIFRKGLTLVLSDDVNLKINLATELASIHGRNVLLETIPYLKNQILCASYDWWIKNSFLIQVPEQIIIPLLPIPNLSDPFNSLTVSHYKKLSRDWFREFLLPNALIKLERSIAPLRRNSGKLVILDGRANKRKWGRLLLRSIQPSEEIIYMFPFD